VTSISLDLFKSTGLTENIYDRCQHEGSYHLLATDMWHWFLQWQDTNLDATAGKIVKCQCSLHGGLMCTICYPCAMYISKSEKFLGICIFVTLWSYFLNFLVPSTIQHATQRSYLYKYWRKHITSCLPTPTPSQLQWMPLTVAQSFSTSSLLCFSSVGYHYICNWQHGYFRNRGLQVGQFVFYG
jgi:hypothetical protein